MAVSLLSQNYVGVLANAIDDVVEIEDEKVKEEIEKDIIEVSNELKSATNELMNGEVNYEGLANVNTIKDGVKSIVELDVEKKVEAAKVLVNSGKSLTEMNEAIALAKKAVVDANSKLGGVQLDLDSARNQVISIDGKIMLLEVDILSLVSMIDEMIKREVVDSAALEEYRKELEELNKEIDIAKEEKAKAEKVIKDAEEEKKNTEATLNSVVDTYETLQKAKEILVTIKDNIEYLQSEFELLKTSKNEMDDANKEMTNSIIISNKQIHDLLTSYSRIVSMIEEVSKLDRIEATQLLEVIKKEFVIAIDALVSSSGNSILDELNEYIDIYESSARSYEEDKSIYEESSSKLVEVIDEYEAYVDSLDTFFKTWLKNELSVEILKEKEIQAHDSIVDSLGDAFEFEYWGQKYVITYKDIISARHNEQHADKVTLEDLLNRKAHIKKNDVCKYDLEEVNRKCKERVDYLNRVVNDKWFIRIDQKLIEKYNKAKEDYQEGLKRDEAINGEFGDNEATKDYFIQKMYKEELKKFEDSLDDSVKIYNNAIKQYASSFVAHTIVERINEIVSILEKSTNAEIAIFKEHLLNDIVSDIRDIDDLKGLLIGDVTSDEETLLRLFEEIEESILLNMIDIEVYKGKEIIYSEMARSYATTLATAIGEEFVTYEFDEQFVVVVKGNEGEVKYSLNQIKAILEKSIVQAEDAIALFKAYDEAVLKLQNAEDEYSKLDKYQNELTSEQEVKKGIVDTLGYELDKLIAEKALLKDKYDIAYKQKEEVKEMLEKINNELNTIKDTLTLYSEALKVNQEKLDVVEKEYTEKVNASNNKPSTGGTSRPKNPSKDKEEEITEIEEEEIPVSPAMTNPVIESIADESLREYLGALVAFDAIKAYSTFGLKVYANSRVTSIDKTSTGFRVSGYMWIDNVKPDKNTWREFILINTEDMTTQYAYRKQGSSARTDWLNDNVMATQNGKLDLKEAGYTINVSYNDLNSYVDNKSGAKIKPGTYQMFIRISDGKESFLFPLVDRVLSDGSTMESDGTLPEGFKVMDNKIRSLVVEVK